MNVKLLFSSLLIFCSSLLVTCVRYQPDWKSLDTRPLPAWYDDVKLGIFIHWGVFSVPSFGSEWFWQNWQGYKNPKFVKFMNENYPGKSYAEFGPQFGAEFYDPDAWAELFKKSGAKYVVLTSKHHEGFTLWPSNSSWNWNAKDVGPKQDLLGKLATATRKAGLTFGVYHSLYEWFNPMYLDDKAKNFTTNNFVKEKTMPELRDLVTKYEPDVIWSDGDWETNEEYWTTKDFLSWLYNDSPVKDTVVVNDRWGQGVTCNHGDFLTCSDRFNPGKLQAKKWENAMTLDKQSWGYVRQSKASDYLTIRELLLTLAQTISFGGNLLVNVGPTSDGRIPPIMEERLLQLGQWLEINSVAVYKTTPWAVAQNDSLTPNVYYTQSKEDRSQIFVTFFDWPKDGKLNLGSVKSTGSSLPLFTLNGVPGEEPLPVEKLSDGSVVVTVGSFPYPTHPALQWAWTLTGVHLTFDKFREIVFDNELFEFSP